MPRGVPQLFISRTVGIAFFLFTFFFFGAFSNRYAQPVSHTEFDVDMIGDCDVVVTELCRRAGWKLQHDMIPENQKINVELEGGFPSRYSFTATLT